MIQRISETIVSNESGAGADSIAAGSADERKLANFIERELRSYGLDVRQEHFPVRTYDFGKVALTVNGVKLDAISLAQAGGTWGTRDGVAYRHGNDTNGKRVRATLVDAGDGRASDYERIGDVQGKAVMVRSPTWPLYQILEAIHRGAAAIILYDNPDGRADTLRQDVMQYHEQLSTVAIRKRDALALREQMRVAPVEIVLENRIDSGDGRSQNVIATIRGAELPDEWVVISAHYDR